MVGFGVEGGFEGVGEGWGEEGGEEGEDVEGCWEGLWGVVLVRSDWRSGEGWDWVTYVCAEVGE